ncbi:hypothetical protein [Rhizobium freirei]|uniref:hypothetical protein n=1 Tax=Rhizobium freirei TaxID=1353277 RepID=UPI00039BA341|nr:hypothetical protein [Rhizobium freirei]
MTIVTANRQASFDEIVAEMDRRGSVIETLEAERDELQAEVDLLRKMQKAAGETSMLYEIRRELGWNDKTSLSIMPNGVRQLRHDALRYQYLRDHCSSFYPMTHEQPAEWSIGWEFQQVKPHEAWGSFDKWIDADIEAHRQKQATLDAEDSQ